MATKGSVGACLNGTQALGRRLPKIARAPTDWRLQMVDGLDPVQLPFDAIELAAKVSDGASVVRPVPIELNEDFPTALDGRLVLESPGLVEEVGNLLRAHVPYPVNVEQGRLAAERVDLLHEPLKELGGLWRLGKDPRRPAEAHGSHALELSPDADAMPGRRGGQGGQQGQPAHGSQSNA